MSTNPFGVRSPEKLDPQYIADNFVDVFTDLPHVKDPGNTFISGARGTGKSMLLRALEPAVMLASREIQNIKQLRFFSIHVPLKQVWFGSPEFQRLAGYARLAIGEHLLTMQIVFTLVSSLGVLHEQISLDDARKFRAEFNRLLSLSGGKAADTDPDGASSTIFATVKSVCEAELIKVRQYYTRMPFEPQVQPYHGALTGFLDFLVPLSMVVKRFASLNDVPLFVMLDDADNLPQHLQRVLNSWVSTRSTHVVCLKITTQLGYATYRTVDDRLIESPHDFSEVNLSVIYTSRLDIYSKRVKQIVERRFKIAEIDSRPETFFPVDGKQAARLGEITKEIIREHESKMARGEKGPARSRDEAIRIAVPRLMTELSGTSRSSQTFSYAGFESMVNLSSGVLRWFLEPARRMYDHVVSEQKGLVPFIPVDVQDKVVWEWAREFLQWLSDVKITSSRDDPEEQDDDADASLHAVGHNTERFEQLRNLLDGLGSLFRKRLLDEKSKERRLFSVVVRNKPSRDLQDVLDLGERLGYLQTADNAAKEAGGIRLPRYILARRLGPYYHLDISGYAAHLSVTAGDLETALRNPREFVRKRLKEFDRDATQLPLDLEQKENDIEA
jgi:hypothetical protein